jgi:hypothetical protein
MKKGLIIWASTLTIIAIAIMSVSFSQEKVIQEQKKEIKYTSKEDNAKCLTCHAAKHYTLANPEDTTKTIHKKMFAELFIDSAAYYVSNHPDFKCTDCHSEEYLNFPHSKKLAFETMQSCMDCHGGDPQFAKLHFEGIEQDYNKSIHAIKVKEGFTCWKCHDAHTYTLNARNRNQNIEKTIAYDNAICLNCHGDDARKQLVVDTKEPNLMAKHEWLPNHTSHMKKVRCIECHAEQNDSIMVAHNIMPKEKAVKKCVACHSKNSLLTQSLYKFQVQEQRSKNGFFNSIILNNTYVIGANRNYVLNMLSQLMFGLTLLGIAIHAILRYRAYKKRVKK